MTERRQILRIGLPAMVENLLQMLMGMVDSYLVATLGLAAVSGVSVANNITAVFQAIFIAVGAAVSSRYAKAKGSHDETKADNIVTDAISLTVMISLVLGLYAIFFGRWSLQGLGLTEQVANLGGVYLAVVGGAAVLLGLMTTLGGLVRSQGKPKAPMYVSLLTNGINAAVAAWCLFVWHFGIIGVALATVLARLVGVGILLRFLQYDWRHCRLRYRLDRDLVQLVLPAAGERLMMRVGDIAIIAIIVTFGTDVVAGNAIGEVITQFNYMPGMGIAAATVILVAHANGENNLEAEKKFIRASYQVTLIGMLLVSGAIFILGVPLTQLFTHQTVAVQASLVVVTASFLGTPATAGTLIYTATWQGLGNAKLPFYATTFGMWIIRIGIGFSFGYLLGWGLAGVWLATICDNIFRWLLLWRLYHRR